MSTSRATYSTCGSCGHLTLVHRDGLGCIVDTGVAEFCECATTKSELAGQQQVSLSIDTLRALLAAVDPEVATGDLYAYSQQHIALARAALLTASEAS